MIDIEVGAIPRRQALRFLLCCVCLPGLSACGGGPDESAELSAAATDTVEVYFSRGEEIEAVTREVKVADGAGVRESPDVDTFPPTPGTRIAGGDVAILEAALRELLQGPTEAERQSGITSFFSAETAGSLQGVSLEDAGRATVDFVDFSGIIPNASSSFGSTMLLRALNATVFQFPPVQSVEYRFEGSCEAFWNWLQRDCGVVDREEWTAERGEQT